MNTRLKIYYPDTQIEKDIYTNGNEWMTLEDWKNYVGFYHKYITGEVFTEKEWDPTKSKKLVRYKSRPDSYFKYADLTSFTKIDDKKVEIISDKNSVFTRYRAPRAVRRQTTDDDLINGIMQRYFVYKRNEPDRVFFEIDKSQASTYNKSKYGINDKLYGLIQFSWKLTGPENDVFENGILVDPGVVDTNKRIILRHSKKFRKLGEIVTNYKEFTIYDV
jgi:hypothetical protein